MEVNDHLSIQIFDLLVRIFKSNNVQLKNTSLIRVRPMWIEPTCNDTCGYTPKLSDMFDQVLTVLRMDNIDQDHGYAIVTIPQLSYIIVNNIYINVFHDYF